MITLGLVVAAVIVLDRAPFRSSENGYTVIFNGRDLTGWHRSADGPESSRSGHRSAGRWLVRNGAVWGSQDPVGNGGLLLTNREYGDLELVLEMRNDFGPGSGILLRSDEEGRGYEIPVDYHEDGTLMGVVRRTPDTTGHVRSFTFGPTPIDVEPVDTFDLPVEADRWRYLWRHGEWNRLRVRITGDPPTITTWVNGIRVLEWTDSGRRLAPEGHVGLQVEGEGSFENQYVRYRRIRVRRLGDTVVDTLDSGDRRAQGSTGGVVDGRGTGPDDVSVSGER